jgi:hypothetical protein
LNILDRQFDAERPNQKWIADFTYIWAAEGWLYVSAVIDLFSRRVVGWSMSAGMTAQLVADALLMTVWRRGKPNELLHHSDQGSQYASEQFQRLMADSGIVCSMSRFGNVWDNAAMESFFSSLKTERTARKIYRTRNEARADCVRLHRAVLQPCIGKPSGYVIDEKRFFLQCQIEERRERRKCVNADKRLSCQRLGVRACLPVKHPCWNFRPTICLRLIQRAAKDEIISLVDTLMNANSATKPRIMPIKHLAKNGPVCVLKRCGTTPIDVIRPSATQPC